MANISAQWQALMESIEAGWRVSRRSDRVSLLPMLPLKLPNQVQLKFDVNTDKPVALFFTPAKETPLLWYDSKDRIFKELNVNLLLNKTSLDTVFFDGLELRFLKDVAHIFRASLKLDSPDMRYELTLHLESVRLSPVLAEANLHRSALRNMTASEAEQENDYFSANCGSGIVIADKSAEACLKIVCDGAQPGRDTTWTVTLERGENYSATTQSTTIQINHAPFIVTQLQQPVLAAETGNIIAQWKSDDPDGPQWRFGVESVSLNFPPQAVGEAMVRGIRFRPTGEASPIDITTPVPFRFSRRTELTVRPSRVDRRYTVHPGDTLSVLRDAELTRMVTELAYPMELTYQQTPDLKRTVIVSEIARALGQPAIALPKSDPNAAMSPLLANYFCKINNIKDPDELIANQRQRHLAARQNFINRLAQFTLKDANYPLRKLDLSEGLSAQLRGKLQGAGAIYPLPDGASLNESQHKALADFVAITPEEQTSARKLPIGLLYSIEYASELMAVLQTPVSKEVRLLELSLSALGATGAVQARFDEGRTQFDARVENGQLSQLVKTRYGRIATVWNKARHVVVYSRSTAPGVQFADEQKDEAFLRWPVLRKMEEYIEILEPYRLFDNEESAEQNKPGCLHAFHFATQRIYINGAWGRDVEEGYEIPLFNEQDSSGFYVKPWAGPVARGGGDTLTQHWHDQPQHLYFYTSTKAGAGAETDKWDARRGIDCDAAFSFGALQGINPPKTDDLLSYHQVPSHTLQALANPRFTMAVRPDGVSNIVHGRGTEELVASVRTMQIERTQATRRVNLSQLPDNALANQLSSMAQHSAELNSLEASILSVLQDAKKLWGLFDNGKFNDGNLKKFKVQLEAQVNAVFDECSKRLNASVGALTGGINGKKEKIISALGLARGLPVVMVDEICRQGSAAVSDLLQKLIFLKEHSADVTTLWPSIENSYSDLPVRLFLDRVSKSFNDPGTQITELRTSLLAIPKDVDSALQIVKSATEQAQTEYDALLKITNTAELTEAIGQYLNKIVSEFNNDIAKLVEIQGKLNALKFPTQSDALQHLRDLLLLPLNNLMLSASTLIPAIQKAFDSIVPEDSLDTMLRKLTLDIPQTLTGIRDSLDQINKAGWKNLLAQSEAKLGKLVEQLEILKNSLFLPLLLQKRALYERLRAAIGSNDFQKELAAFIATLETLNQSLTAQPVTQHSAFAQELLLRWENATTSVDNEIVNFMTTLGEVSKEATTQLSRNAQGAEAELKKRKSDLLSLIDHLPDNAEWVTFAQSLETQLTNTTRQMQEQFVNPAARLFDQQTRQYADKIQDLLEKESLTFSDALPKAGQAIKLMKLLSDPPELPQLTIRTDHIEYVFDDLKDQIETSPFVARLREVDAGIKELGLAIPSYQLNGNIVPASLEGTKFSCVIRNAAIDFEKFFAKFQLPNLPDGAIRVSHHIDPKTRHASVKAEINHQFDSTESLFALSALSLDVRKPTLVATSDVDISVDDATKSRTQALFSGDWILNFSGQPLVTFADARIQYSDATGFKFDIDPKNIEPHAALKFIGDILRGAMPELPPNVEIVKNSAGIPTGASVSQKQTFGPLEYGGVSLGESVLASGFSLQLNNGLMQIETWFGIGEKASPVSMQIGVYGGGGWLTTQAKAAYVDNELKPTYEASIGVALSSTKTFNLASVAQGSYAIRLFVEAGFSSEAANNFFAAGVQMTGTAKVLGYLTAYLNLLVQVEHRNGQMKGRGHLDISIEVCWCYTAHISRTVEQDL